MNVCVECISPDLGFYFFADESVSVLVNWPFSFINLSINRILSISLCLSMRIPNGVELFITLSMLFVVFITMLVVFREMQSCFF